MFCPQCGNKTDDGSDFCCHCGNKMNSIVTGSTYSENKDKEVKMLESAYDCLNSITPYFRKMDDEEDRKKYLKKDIEEGCSFKIKSGVIASIVFIVFLLLAIYFFSIPKSSDIFGDLFSSINAFWGVIWVIVCVISAIVLIVSFSTIPKRKREIEDNKQQILVIDYNLQQLAQELNQFLSSEKHKYNYLMYCTLFPNRDASEKDIENIINLMKSSRADSFKEALNLYDEQCHRERMERLASVQVLYAYETAQSSASAAVSAAEAAASANRAARASEYNAYYK